MRLRLVTYNIHKCIGGIDRRFAPERVRDVLDHYQPDLVFLQEVDADAERSRFHRLSDLLGDMLGLRHRSWFPNVTLRRGGQYGNAILSRFPIVFHENIDVSTTRLESRGLLHAVIDWEDDGRRTPLHAICVHLGLREVDRRSQLERLCARIRSHVPEGEPLVIGGDFNDWRLRATPILMDRLEASEAYFRLHGEHARTFPVWLPALRLDRIYCRGLEIQSASCLTGMRWRALSDHAPVIADLCRPA